LEGLPLEFRYFLAADLFDLASEGAKFLRPLLPLVGVLNADAVRFQLSLQLNYQKATLF
jgi:hypothetical protein